MILLPSFFFSEGDLMMYRMAMILAALAMFARGGDATAQSVLFDFESGGDQGFGAKFSNDASEEFPNGIRVRFFLLRKL